MIAHYSYIYLHAKTSSMRTIIRFHIFGSFLIATILTLSACSSSLRSTSANDSESVVRTSNFSKDDGLIHFQWEEDALKEGVYIFFVPVKLDGIEQTFRMQFDLGLDVNVIYEKPLKTLITAHPALKEKLTKAKDYPTFHHDLFIASEKSNVDSLFLYKNYGSSAPIDSLQTIGSIGVNEIKNKVLILDFPNQTLKIANEIKDENIYSFSPLKVSKRDKLIISTTFEEQEYDFLFDTGNGVPVATTNMELYSAISENAKELNDTIRGNSWGDRIQLTGAKIQKPLKIGDHPIIPNNNELIYHTKAKRIVKLFEGLSKEAGIDLQSSFGLQLFVDRQIIIDLKNNRFGIQKQVK